ncbi:hypothetical protein CHS0354_030229 [Potamilus streckersoni]|uniref:Uncharacterized protein n=1 Tax=Potamilus streckersoni TaxID=2493646 RepID=A0AAE0RSP7_9BIVA|nr:hypothetical protein CHS0354_030229 [Potamilus streckersoni]
MHVAYLQLMRWLARNVKRKTLWFLLFCIIFFVIFTIVHNIDMTCQGNMNWDKRESTMNDKRHAPNETTVKNIVRSKMVVLKESTVESSILASTKGLDFGNEVRHVAFLKVHKAASSTAQNIFLRFGWARNLTFVLSPAKNKFGYPNIISLRESLTNSNILPTPKDKSFDILCNHVMYSKSAFDYFLPKDTMYIGILREPYEQYKSTLNYFHPSYIFNRILGNFPASSYIRDPKKYEPGSVISSWTNNRQALEFGFPLHLFHKFNTSEVQLILEKLASEFRLVIIAELMEESIILMRRYLHWSVKDVVFLDKNVAINKKESDLVQSNDRQFYRQWAKLDYELYEFFFRKLRSQIRDEGPDFDQELLLFKEVRKNTSIFCLNNPNKDEFLPIKKSKWSEPFNITWEDCRLMRMGEITFVQMIRERQYGSKDI